MLTGGNLALLSRSLMPKDRDPGKQRSRRSLFGTTEGDNTACLSLSSLHSALWTSSCTFSTTYTRTMQRMPPL